VAYVSCIETPSNCCVRRAFDDGSPVGKQCHFVRFMPEFQDELVVPHFSVRTEAVCHLGEIDWALPFVNLDGIPTAERNVRTTLPFKVDNLVGATCTASEARILRSHLGVLISPKVPGKQRASHSRPLTY